MTDQQNTIQRARDVLAKWREQNTSEPWVRRGHAIYSMTTRYSVAEKVDEFDAHLIIGTAGNFELLTAIDRLLAYEQEESGVCHCGDDLAHHTLEHNFVDMGYPPNPLAERIAAALVAADERMNA